MANQTPPEYKLASDSFLANYMLLGLLLAVMLLLLHNSWFAPFLLASGVWYLAHDVLEKDEKRHENKLLDATRKKFQLSLVLAKIIVLVVVVQVAWKYFF